MAVLSPEAITARLKDVPGWEYDGREIRKSFQRGDFVGSLMFVQGVALVAQALDHHPDITIRWDTVTLSVATHSQGGITDLDFKLAVAVEKLA